MKRKPKHGASQLVYTVQLVTPDRSTGCGHAYVNVMELQWHDAVQDIRQNIHSSRLEYYTNIAQHLARTYDNTWFLRQSHHSDGVSLIWQDDDKRRGDWYAPRLESYLSTCDLIGKVLKIGGNRETTPQEFIAALEAKYGAFHVSYERELSCSSYVETPDFKLSDRLPDPVRHTRCPIKDSCEWAACGANTYVLVEDKDVTCPKCLEWLACQEAGKVVA